jgi:hypothetical protein
MSIANYSDLQTTVANYLHRADLTSVIPDFITLAEAKLNRVLRLRAMENVATGTVSSTVALPTGFIEMRSLTVSSGGNTSPIPYVTPENITSTSDAPLSYSIVGDNIYFLPSTSGYTYTLTYFKKFDPLSSGVNWLITNAPDAYVYGTLLEAAPYLKDDARANLWLSALQQVVTQLVSANNDDRYGSSLAVRVA